jgi:hypothetical protein
MTANEHMRGGSFGPLLRYGRVSYAALDAVERHSGQQFTKEQVEAARVATDSRRTGIPRAAPSNYGAT